MRMDMRDEKKKTETSCFSSQMYDLRNPPQLKSVAIYSQDKQRNASKRSRARDREVERATYVYIRGEPACQRKEKDEAERKKTELGAEGERQSGIK